MKRSLGILAMLTIIFSACESEGEIPELGTCVQVRMLDSVCATTVLQFVNTDLGEDGWAHHPTNDAVYDNVFTTTLTCSDWDRIPEGADTFWVRIIEEPLPDPGCAVCLALPANAPETRFTVTVVDNCFQER